MSFDDNHQIFFTIPNANGESQAIFFTPEVLPEQLIPLVQKKHLKEDKNDYPNLNSVYKKLLENLSENQGSGNLNNLIDVSSIVNLGEKTKTSSSEALIDNRATKNISSSTTSIIRNLNSGTATFLLQASNLNQTSLSLASSISNDQTVNTESSPNYITAIQISQNSSNLPTLAFNQPQALLHYSKPNQDSTNAVLIPISLQNSNQYSQQKILVAGGYNANCCDGVNTTIFSHSNHSDSINVTSLAKLVSTNSSNSLSTNLTNQINKSTSSCSEISPNSKATSSKSKSGLGNNEEFGKRKEIRLFKNREAARECRRKKKEYVKCLENRVANLEEQNRVLVGEINRMKGIYAITSPKPSNLHTITSEINNKFMEVYENSSDNPLKNEFYEPTTNADQTDPLSSKEKPYASLTGNVVSVSGLVQSTISNNKTSIPKSKPNAASHIDHSHMILSTPSISTADKEGSSTGSSSLFLKFKNDPNSTLSLLLTSGDHNHKSCSQSNIVFPENVPESRSNDPHDS